MVTGVQTEACTPPAPETLDPGVSNSVPWPGGQEEPKRDPTASPVEGDKDNEDDTYLDLFIIFFRMVVKSPIQEGAADVTRAARVARVEGATQAAGMSSTGAVAGAAGAASTAREPGKPEAVTGVTGIAW